MAVPRGWCLHGYRCGVEKKGTGGRWRQEGDGDARVGARARHVCTPISRRGWCIAYYLCVVFVAALRAFFCSHRLLFISTNVQLYWSAIYHPHPAPPTSRWIFFLFSRMYPDFTGGWKFATIGPARDGTTADATLCCAGMSRNFILPSWMPRLNLPPGSLFLHAATVLHGKNLAILIFLWCRRFPAVEREYRICTLLVLRALRLRFGSSFGLWIFRVRWYRTVLGIRGRGLACVRACICVYIWFIDI